MNQTILLNNFGYDPQSTTVLCGGWVTFVNEEDYNFAERSVKVRIIIVVVVLVVVVVVRSGIP